MDAIKAILSIIFIGLVISGAWAFRDVLFGINYH